MYIAKLANSNYIAANGLQITEGSRVHRTDQDDYRNSGDFLVLRCDEVGELNIPMIELANPDGSQPSCRYSTPEELRVLVR